MRFKVTSATLCKPGPWGLSASWSLCSGHSPAFFKHCGAQNCTWCLRWGCTSAAWSGTDNHQQCCARFTPGHGWPFWQLGHTFNSYSTFCQTNTQISFHRAALPEHLSPQCLSTRVCSLSQTGPFHKQYRECSRVLAKLILYPYYWCLKEQSVIFTFFFL